MKFIIAEKSSVMRDIVSVIEPTAEYVAPKNKTRVSYYEGEDYVFACAWGHLLNFKSPRDIDEKYGLKVTSINDFPMDLPHPIPMVVPKEKKSYFDTLNDIFKKYTFDEIIVATDGDREGQGIYERIKAYLPNFPKDVYESRVWLNEWSPEGFLSSFENRFPNTQKENLKNAAYLRAYLDYSIGMNGTGLATAVLGSNIAVINIGRVQTTVGTMIMNRENTILNFKPQDYTVLSLETKTDETDKNIVLKHKVKDNQKLSKQEADDIRNKIKNVTSVSLKVSKKTSESKQLTLCDAMDIQKEMNKKYGYSAKQTADLLQKLYQDRKLTTYPGTKAHQISVSAAQRDTKPLENLRGLGICDELIEKVFENNWHIAKHCVTDKGMAHEAITPVFGSINKNVIQELSEPEMKVYKAVVERYLQAFYPKAVYSVSNVETEIEQEKFATSGKVLMEKGYLEVIGIPSDNLLPKVTDGNSYDVVKINEEQKQTTPPSRFNEATLLEAMKSASRYIDDEHYSEILNEKDVEGLGTSRTRPLIIEGMKKNEYLELKGKTIYPTNKLKQLIEILPDDISIKSPVATAKMEEALQNVEDGLLDANEYEQEILQETEKLCDSIKEVSKNGNGKILKINTDYGTCPQCGKPLLKRKGKFGDFLSCSGYPDCKYIKNLVQETGEKCPQCGSPLVKRKGKFGIFTSCSNYPTCKYIKPKKGTKTTEEKCPKCGSPLVIKKGKYGNFYACSSYPKCDYIKNVPPKETGKKCPQCGKPLVMRKGPYGNFIACSGYPECKYMEKAASSTKTKKIKK